MGMPGDAGHDILVLPMLPTTIITADVSGFINIGVVMDAVQPLWYGDNRQGDVACARWNVVEKVRINMRITTSRQRIELTRTPPLPVHGHVERFCLVKIPFYADVHSQGR